MGNVVAALRKSDGKWGFLDIKTGRQLHPFVYDEVHERSYNPRKGTVEVEQGEDTVEITLRTGRALNSPAARPRAVDQNLYTWKDPKLFYADTVNRLLSIYDKKLKKTLVFGFDEVPEHYYTEDEYSGLLVCVCDGKYGLIDDRGKIVESFLYPVNKHYIIHRGSYYVSFYDTVTDKSKTIQFADRDDKFYLGELDLRSPAEQ
ncbi:MAG: hypothetical protein IJV37_08685 [Bacteroidales bacterium]|nr:hypothetical protein [Bacteroidales bacterium]